MVKKGINLSKLSSFDYIYHHVNKINRSPLFAGILAIMTNIGSKYITIKISKSQEAYLRNSIARQILIFCILWSGSRDVLTALILTAVFSVLTDHLFNEDSDYCVIPHHLRTYEKAIDQDGDGIITPAEAEAALETLNKLKRQKRKQEFMRNMKPGY